MPIKADDGSTLEVKQGVIIDRDGHTIVGTQSHANERPRTASNHQAFVNKAMSFRPTSVAARVGVAILVPALIVIALSVIVFFASLMVLSWALFGLVQSVFSLFGLRLPRPKSRMSFTSSILRR